MQVKSRVRIHHTAAGLCGHPGTLPSVGRRSQKGPPPMKKSTLAVGIAAACLAVPAFAGPAFGVSTEILRLKFDETVTAGNYAQGQTIFDNVAPAQDGILDLQGTAPGFITQVSSPISGFGKAMKFGNAGCGASSCTSQGVIKIEDSVPGVFTPGSGNFEWGGTVQLTNTISGMGMNVIQKGRSATEDMWKLQLDGGKASCVIKIDNASPASTFAKAETTSALTVGHNYKLRCKRVSGVLTLVVTEFAANGSQIGSPVTYVNTGGSAVGNVNNFGAADDVYIGAKGTPSSPDQLRDTILDTVTYWAG